MHYSLDGKGINETTRFPIKITISNLLNAIILLNLFTGCGGVSSVLQNRPIKVLSIDRSPKVPAVKVKPAVTANVESSLLKFTSWGTAGNGKNFESGDALGISSETALIAESDDLAINSFELQTFEMMNLDSGGKAELSSQLRLVDRLVSDQSSFYSPDSLLTLGASFGVGAVIANSNLDGQLQKHFQASVRGATSDEWFEFLKANKELGNGIYTLPIMGAAWAANEYFDGPPALESFGIWGERSIRGFVVGAPPLIVMQRITGGSRPQETSEGSEWQPFSDNNGVSGHAFMSSLPFITAAKLSENRLTKSLWYVGSMIGPLSRINGNAHYPSQSGLGWAMAYVAASAVQETDTGDRGWRILPTAPSGESGLGIQFVW